MSRGRSRNASSSREARVESRNRTVGCALRARAARGASKDGRLPGADWRAVHSDAAAGRYGVEADLALGYGSASQPVSRSKLHAPGGLARRSTTRTFRDDPEVARAAARVARARVSKAADAATPVAAAKLFAIRGRSAAAFAYPPEGSQGVPEGSEGSRASPDASASARLASRGRLRAREGLGGGNLAAGPSEAEPSRAARSRRAEETRRERDSDGSGRRRGAGDPASPASHIARLGALSASFNDRQRVMVGRGVQEARTRIRDERSWGR